MRKRIILAAGALLLGAGFQDPASADRAAVERAALDYVEGVYEVKPELIERSVHPDLAKVGFSIYQAKRQSFSFVAYETDLKCTGIGWHINAEITFKIG